ncbi:MAG: hypothetical protein JSS86_02855 [Cyanobacteria bacterium SZAS LIN-2]|nr:hypothetical protein [Cyanobacteria bacterium SZAS LIN-2]
MPTPLSSIGFKLYTQEESWQLATVVAEKGRRVSTADGNYVCLTTDCGSELWAKLDAENRPYAILPHFAGLAKSQILVTQRIRYNDRPLDGRLLGWINPSQSTLGFGGPPGDYPVLFEAPDYAFYTFMEVPCTVTVQLAAFAQTLQTFPSVEAYDASPDKAWPVETLLPSGTAGLHGYQRGDKSPHSNEAFIIGIVKATKTYENPLTYGQFQWAGVKVMGGLYDVCIDPELLNGPLTTGQVIAGNFWLSGRLVFNH